MHSYNPFETPDTIAVIVQKLPLEALDKFCWINSTWYKEIQNELRRRWKIQVLEYYELGLREDLELKEVGKKHPYDHNAQRRLYTDILEFYSEKGLEACEAQMEIEKCMLHNGMLDGQEKEIVKYNIMELIEYDHTYVPWVHYNDYMDDAEFWDTPRLPEYLRSDILYECLLKRDADESFLTVSPGIIPY
jgi:hypothetical protein